MRDDLGRARQFQADLALEVKRLAALIAVPALDRDIEAVAATWADLQNLYAPLGVVFRRLRRAATRHQGKDPESRALKDEVKALDRQLRFWDEVERLVGRHLASPSTALNLDYEPQPNDDMTSYLYAALHTLANPNEQADTAEDHECFADIAMSIRSFEQMMSAAYRLLLVQGRTATARFLDVGCGGGTKVIAASRWFPRCDGLEYDPGYAKAGQRTIDITMPGRGEVFEGDALQFDNYGAYDVIYYYRPISNPALLRQMQDRIVAKARPGTVIIAPLDHDLSPWEPYPCAQIKGCVFVTGVTQDEADHWHANAERTDTTLIRRAKDFRHDSGMWAPLFDAASFNGAARPKEGLLPKRDEIRFSKQL